MTSNRTRSSDLSGFDTRLGPDDPERPVAVPAGELDEWAWLLGRLAGPPRVRWRLGFPAAGLSATG
jgi:hypothetical protein